MAKFRHPQWRNEWDATKYPFADGVSLQNAAGDMLLEGTFIDAHLYPIGGAEGLFLSRVDISSRAVTIVVGDANTDELATGEFLTNDPDAGTIKLEDAYGRPAGILVSERSRLGIMQAWGVGSHAFTRADTEFAVTCCMPTPEIGVRGIMLEDGSLFTGPVWIVGDDGVVVRHEAVTVPGKCGVAPATHNVIRIDVVGDPLFRRRLCESQELFNTPNPIRKIRVVNGVQEFEVLPDAGGNVTIQMNDGLVPDPAMRIRQTREGLIFETMGTSTTP
jgi:hypothetical protein